MKIFQFVAVGLGSAALIVASSASAFAGEKAREHTNSICAFSGLDLEDGVGEVNPPPLDDDLLAERGNQSPGGVDRYHGVQNYGIFVRADIPAEFMPPSPGMACNGHTGLLAGGGEE